MQNTNRISFFYILHMCLNHIIYTINIIFSLFNHLKKICIKTWNQRDISDWKTIIIYTEKVQF